MVEDLDEIDVVDVGAVFTGGRPEQPAGSSINMTRKTPKIERRKGGFISRLLIR